MMILTLANTYQIIPPCHNFKNIIHLFFEQKFCLHFFRKLKKTRQFKDETINNSKIHLPFVI